MSFEYLLVSSRQEVTNKVLCVDEGTVSRDWINNLRDNHQWNNEDPHGIDESSDEYRFYNL